LEFHRSPLFNLSSLCQTNVNPDQARKRCGPAKEKISGGVGSNAGTRSAYSVGIEDTAD
jgi:hypothetical protein